MPQQPLRAGDGKAEQQVGLLGRDPAAEAGDALVGRDRAGEVEECQARAHAVVKPAGERRQLVAREAMEGTRPEGDRRFINVARRHRIAGDDFLERVGGDGAGVGQLVAGIERLADQLHRVFVVAELVGRDRGHRPRRQHRPQQVEPLALAVLGLRARGRSPPWAAAAG